jgi:hypothetical protein
MNNFNGNVLEINFDEGAKAKPPARFVFSILLFVKIYEEIDLGYSQQMQNLPWMKRSKLRSPIMNQD